MRATPRRGRIAPAKKVDYCCKVSCADATTFEYCEQVRDSNITHQLCTSLKASARATYNCSNNGGSPTTNTPCYTKR
ncbi:MAG: hypothetical protein KC501_13640 [Myxococcales bacterium]|nr:hypothetical protein [Myxococcales bacterium]